MLIFYVCAACLSACLQVSAAEERHRGLKEALESDIAAIGGHADKIKVGGKGAGTWQVALCC